MSDVRRARRRAEQRRYRERCRRNIRIARVAVSDEVMTWMFRHGYCSEHDLVDSDKLGRRISEMLAASARA